MNIDYSYGNTTGMPLLSFFTGGGFFDIGFEMAGFSIIWTNEKNRAFARMYAYGMTRWRRSVIPQATNTKITTMQDIETLSAHKIRKQASLANYKHYFGVIGGPPCPDFSNAGLHQGANGKNGKLAGTFVRRITALSPAFFVLENVAGLYRIKTHRAYLSKLVTKLQEAGYCVDLKVINALEFGVPQDRERLFVIGIRKTIAEICLGRAISGNARGWFHWPEAKKYKDAKTNYNWPNMSEFGSTPNLSKEIPYELTVDNAFKKLPKGNQNDQFKPYSSRFTTVEEGNTKRKSFKRLHRYRFSPTVCYGHNEVHLHPSEPRRLSVREAMRIQGIPDEYLLPSSETLGDKFTLVSNGVPVPLAYEIANSIKNFLQQVPSEFQIADDYGYLE